MRSLLRMLGKAPSASAQRRLAAGKPPDLILVAVVQKLLGRADKAPSSGPGEMLVGHDVRRLALGCSDPA